jgi:hypothetical protein
MQDLFYRDSNIRAKIVGVSIACAEMLDYIFLSTARAQKWDDMSHTEHKFLYNVA